jgi:hypothetical protein
VGDELARDEDDHDLLTFNESAIRLREEIALTEAALGDGQAPSRRAALEARLSALTDALERNTRQAGDNPGEKGFLDYVPPRPAGQRRGRSIAMTAAETDEFLAAERTCRVATAGPDGRPHVVPLWFVWDGTSLWLNSVVRSQRWTDLARDPRVAVVVDAGDAYNELRGLELSGTVVPVGDAPRTDAPEPALATPERLFADKYAGGGEFAPDGHHGWLRLTPDKLVSWDFRKLAGRSG